MTEIPEPRPAICQSCVKHRGWAHGDEGRRTEALDTCPDCLGSGLDYERALDVWLRLDYEDEEASAEAEANVFRDGTGYRVDWYLDAVGLVRGEYFDTYAEAAEWLVGEGFDDYTILDDDGRMEN